MTLITLQDGLCQIIMYHSNFTSPLLDILYNENNVMVNEELGSG